MKAPKVTSGSPPKKSKENSEEIPLYKNLFCPMRFVKFSRKFHPTNAHFPFPDRFLGPSFLVTEYRKICAKVCFCCTPFKCSPDGSFPQIFVEKEAWTFSRVFPRKNPKNRQILQAISPLTPPRTFRPPEKWGVSSGLFMAESSFESTSIVVVDIMCVPRWPY